MLFLILLLAHLIGDFVFQTNRIAAEKSGFNRAMRKHVVTHFVLVFFSVTIYLLTHPSVISLRDATFIIIAIPLIHFAVDAAKVCTDRARQKYGKYSGAFTYLVDQVLHILFLLILLDYPTKIMGVNQIFQIVVALLKGQHLVLTAFGHILALSILVIMVTRFSGFLVGSLAGPEPKKDFVITDKKVVLTTTYPPKPSQDMAKSEVVYMHMDDPDPPRGMLIGYLERLIIMLLVYGQAYSAIAFIATAKSLVRFKQMEHREWAEYFLVGTLSSMLLGLVAGHVLRSVL